MTNTSDPIRPYLTPVEICRAALISVGVPRQIIEDLKQGPVMDYWVHQTVIKGRPWQEVWANSVREELDSLKETLAKHGLAEREDESHD